MTDCVLTRNSVDWVGGAIYNGACTLTMTNCVLTSNSNAGKYAGAIYTRGPLTMTDCLLESNSVTGDPSYGGAIYNSGIMSPTPTSTLDGCVLRSNYAGSVRRPASCPRTSRARP